MRAIVYPQRTIIFHFCSSFAKKENEKKRKPCTGLNLFIFCLFIFSVEPVQKKSPSEATVAIKPAYVFHLDLYSFPRGLFARP